jgi:hypothetical protein
MQGKKQLIPQKDGPSSKKPESWSLKAKKVVIGVIGDSVTCFRVRFGHFNPLSQYLSFSLLGRTI